MQKILLYIFILIVFSCVNKKDRLISELKSTVDYVSENKDSLTTEMLVVYNSQITELEEITFPSQQKNMSPEEINQVNILFNKYNVIKTRIEVGEFIYDIKYIVEYVSENKDSLTTEMLDIYNSQITDLEEIIFPSQQKNMSPDEINQVNMFFKKYYDIKERIEVREFINEIKFIVNYVSENKSILISETLEIYNSKIDNLREYKYLLIRNKMIYEEINDVNLLFGKYDALVITIQLNDFKNLLNDGLKQGVNTINELLK